MQSKSRRARIFFLSAFVKIDCQKAHVAHRRYRIGFSVSHSQFLFLQSRQPYDKFVIQCLLCIRHVREEYLGHSRPATTCCMTCYTSRFFFLGCMHFLRKCTRALCKHCITHLYLIPLDLPTITHAQEVSINLLLSCYYNSQYICVCMYRILIFFARIN